MCQTKINFMVLGIFNDISCIGCTLIVHDPMSQVMGGNGSLPSLSELLTKSVAELSEEVITLKLELETEKR